LCVISNVARGVPESLALFCLIVDLQRFAAPLWSYWWRPYPHASGTSAAKKPLKAGAPERSSVAI
jgi:hypothetical protein